MSGEERLGLQIDHLCGMGEVLSVLTLTILAQKPWRD